MITVHHGECLAHLRSLEPESVDAIVTDSPYGLGSPPPILDVLRAWLAGDEYRPKGRGFMGHAWDAFVPGPEVWRECLRVLKPGGHLLAFFGSRTVDIGGLAIRLAGFEIRDQLQWLHGQGFPKSLDVSKAIDKIRDDVDDEWEGWGTAIKPAHEPIVLARKPLAEGTVAAQVLATGTGAINVDGCRIGNDARINAAAGNKPGGSAYNMSARGMPDAPPRPCVGRWPANVILDEEAAEMLDAQSGPLTSGSRKAGVRKGLGYHGADGDGGPSIEKSQGGASRFFYCAKASKAERGADNTHPTVKPVALMRWLVRMVTPPGGIVLDPFAGSGTTLVAAQLEGFDALGIEQSAEYIEIIRRRLAGVET